MRPINYPYLNNEIKDVYILEFTALSVFYGAISKLAVILKTRT